MTAIDYAALVERLKEHFAYDTESGVFTWVKPTNSRIVVGSIAGCKNGSGYIDLRAGGKVIKAHRVAWAFVNGTFPPDQLDHINGIKTDNRIINLRPATNKQNMRNRGAQSNNTTGIKGVSITRYGRFKATIKVDGKSKHLGCFKTKDDAAEAYKRASIDLFGEFSVHSKTRAEAIAATEQKEHTE